MHKYNNVKVYKLDSKKKVREWSASYYPLPDGTYEIKIIHGQQNGSMQTKLRSVKSGKNKGKVNETTVEEQASLELGYLYQKQFDDGYVLDVADYKEPFSPVLAHKYADKKHKVVWSNNDPSIHPKDKNYASTKLNGIRCFIFVVDGKATLFESRTRKAFKFFTHIADEISLAAPDVVNGVFDGELFNPDIPFEILASLINSDNYVSVTDPDTGKTWNSSDVQFHWYDYVDTNDLTLGFYNRFLARTTDTSTTHIVKVDSVVVESEDDMVVLAKEWIAEGHEGLMLRAGDTPYEFGKRSTSLLKYKIMEQSEFLIKRVYLAENDATKVMFTLENHFNTNEPYNTFDCAVKGNKEINLQYFTEKEKHEGHSWLTVDYQTLSAYKVPLFPVGIVIRKGNVVDGTFVPEV